MIPRAMDQVGGTGGEGGGGAQVVPPLSARSTPVPCSCLCQNPAILPAPPASNISPCLALSTAVRYRLSCLPGQVFATARELEAQGWRYEMRAAMLEVYNEELRDLLGKGPPQGKKHMVREGLRALPGCCESILHAESPQCLRRRKQPLP